MEPTKHAQARSTASPQHVCCYKGVQSSRRRGPAKAGCMSYTHVCSQIAAAAKPLGGSTRTQRTSDAGATYSWLSGSPSCPKQRGKVTPRQQDGRMSHCSKQAPTTCFQDGQGAACAAEAPTLSHGCAATMLASHLGRVGRKPKRRVDQQIAHAVLRTGACCCTSQQASKQAC